MRDLEGLNISGTIPVPDSMLNKLIDEYVKPNLNGSSSSSPSNGGDFGRILPYLDIYDLRVATGTGKVVVHLKVRV